MTDQKRCKRCNKFVKDTRTDKQFCSDRCAAAWAREQGYNRERFHAEKDETINKNCEWCGNAYVHNEYAERAGQREAKFCSNKCRQANYRARKAAAGKTGGYTGHWDDARNDKSNTGTSQGTGKEWYERAKAWNDEQERKRNEEKVRNQQKQSKGTQQENTQKGTQQPNENSRWASKDAYRILGVTYHSTKADIKKAYRDLIRTYHPDTCKDPNATVISQAINWAYGILKKQVTR